MSLIGSNWNEGENDYEFSFFSHWLEDQNNEDEEDPYIPDGWF